MRAIRGPESMTDRGGGGTGAWMEVISVEKLVGRVVGRRMRVESDGEVWWRTDLTLCIVMYFSSPPS
jgi:hypothetical protein